MNHLRIPGRIIGACTLVLLSFITGSSFTAHGQDKSLDKASEKTSAPTPSEEDNTQFFTQKVRPVLAQNCYRCHTTEVAGGLRLDSHAAVLKGGESGPAIVPGDPEKSLLIEAIRQTGDLKMPPKGDKLPDSEIANIVEWVRRGGVWDSAEPAKPVVALLTAAQAKGTPGDDFFENKVRPILATQCGSCHQERAAGDLSLSSRDSILKGGNSGPAIVPGDPEKSLLLTAVHQTGSLKMPKGGSKLSADDIEALSDWVKMGAPWPQVGAPVRVAGKQITPDMRKFWSFQPLKDYPVPAVKDPALKSWAKTDIDRFVLAKLEENGLKPA